MSIDKRRKESLRQLYAEVRNIDPALWQKAVNIGSLVTCAPPGTDPQRIAADVEAAVMSLIKEL